MKAAIVIALAISPAISHAQDEVIVQGSRLSAFRGDVLFSHVDIDSDVLARSASVDQALKAGAQASLFRRSSSLTANPTIQGLNLRAIAPSGAGRALVTLNGIPQNDPFGGWVIWPALPAQIIDRARVLRGAGGGAYGAGALTGVVQFSLSNRSVSYIDASAGSHASSQVVASLANGPIMLTVSDATYRGDIPVRGGQNGPADVSTYGQDQTALGHADWQMFDGVIELIAGAFSSRRDTGLAMATSRASGDQFSLGFTRQPSHVPGFNLQAWRKDSNLTNRSVSILPDRSATSVANDQVKTPAIGLGFNAGLRGQTKSREWEIGIDDRYASGESREYYRYISGRASRYRVSGGDSRISGVYALGTQSIGRVIVTGAVRLDTWRAFGGHRSERDTTTDAITLDVKPSDQSDTIMSGRIGAGIQIGGIFWRVASYSGFRPPTLNELYRPFRVGNDITEANDRLLPEQLRGAEVGFRVRNETWQIDADLFMSDLQNPIVNVTLGQGPGVFGSAGFIPAGGNYRQRRNEGRIDATGLETQVGYTVTQNLDLRFAMTVTHARVNNRRPAQAPAIAGNAGLSWRSDAFDLDMDWAFEGERFEDDLNVLRLEPYDIASAAMTYKLASGVRLSLKIDNLFNKKIEYERGSFGSLGYKDGRAFWLGVGLRV